ncbi:sigma-X negative effector [Bacillus atrophaeus]|uniref:sigma-X negative effector n=1 Tax=Bacillus atrophaeus TaxID=1452 RepID=UPI002282A0BD|nr:sigma-X negative effector [Bacillus atrophaeus]MCY8526107.1 sigma-X negative effector [Bacillus atrophaeus]
MMKSDWNEERIKELLNQLPIVKDQRSANDIYACLLKAKHKKKLPVSWIGPAVATAIVVYIAFIISPHLFPKSQFENKETADDSAAAEMKLADSQKSEAARIQKTFVVSDKDQNKYITVAFANAKTSTIIPVSIEKTNSGENIQDMLFAYDHSDLFDTGISVPSFIDDVKVTENQKELLIQVKQQITVDSSKEAKLLEKMLNETMKWSPYDRIKFTTDQGDSGADIGSYGTLTELPVHKQTQRGYYAHQDEEGHYFLVPSEKTYHNISDAIKGMENSSNSDTRPIIKSGTVKSVTEKNDSLLIYFSKESVVENSISSILMLEGLLLTAKDFGYTKVTFKNTKTHQVGKYDVTEPVSVPSAPNPIHIN